MQQKKKQDATPLHVFTGSVEHAIAHIEESVEMTVDHRYLRWFAMKLFERDEEAVKDLNIPADVKAISSSTLLTVRMRWMMMQRVLSQTRDMLTSASV